MNADEQAQFTALQQQLTEAQNENASLRAQLPTAKETLANHRRIDRVAELEHRLSKLEPELERLRAECGYPPESVPASAPLAP